MNLTVQMTITMKAIELFDFFDNVLGCDVNVTNWPVSSTVRNCSPENDKNCKLSLAREE